jgi:hypothetical protein
MIHAALSASPNRPRRASRLVAHASLLFSLTAASQARAEDLPTEAMAARRELIERAQTARQAGDHTAALDLAQRAGQVEMSVSLRRFIAEEQLEVGEPAAALGSAEVCARDARASGKTEHADACAALVAKAKELVAFVVIRVAPDVPGALVKLGPSEVPRALWGQRYVVKPGLVQVSASAPNHEPATASVEVARGAVGEIVVTLRELPARPDPERLAPGPEAPVPSTFELSPWVPIGGSVAVAGFAVALGLGLSGVAALSDYEERCTARGAPAACVDEQAELQADLDRRAVGVNVALGTAAAGLVAGTIGIFLSGVSDEQRAALWSGKVLF